MMTLLDLKYTFSHLNDDNFVFAKAFDAPHVYDLEYDEIAFEPANNIRLLTIKRDINLALTDVFSHPYHGTCRYAEYTPVNLAFIGCSGDDDIDNFQKLVTDMLNEYSDAHQSVEPKKKRKTAAEKRQEQQAVQDAANAAYWELFKKEYPVKFAALMWDYFKYSQTDRNFNITRDNDNYVFTSVDGWNQIVSILSVEPPQNYSWEYLQTFLDAEQSIEREREKQREAERKELLKQTALAKLSDEERKVLGL